MDYRVLLKKVLYMLGILIFVYLTLKFAYFYIPFVIAYVISIMLEPMIKFISNKTKLTRKSSSIIALIIFFIFFIGIVVYGIISIILESNNLLENLNVYIENIFEYFKIFSNKINELKIPNEIAGILENTGVNIINIISNKIREMLVGVLNFITVIPNLLVYFFVTILATYFITSDKFYILDRLEHHFSRKTIGKLKSNINKITSALGKFIKAEIILIGISFFIVLLGLNFFKVIGMNIKYPSLVALLIGFVDALPILGTGTVMIPWVFICFIKKDISFGFMILGLYLLILCVRQFLEPKIISRHIGIHPIFTVISMYTGFKIIGLIGMIVGPVVLIICKILFSNLIEVGFINYFRNDF